MMETAAIAGHIFRALGNGHGAGESMYVAVPGNEKARWLLPAKCPEIGGVLANWAPYRLSARAAWTAVRAANKLGRVTDLPGAALFEAEGAGESDWWALGWRSAEAPVPVIYLGTPGPQRKAVVHLVERKSGKCKAVVKVPLADEAKATVLHEAEVLEALAAERYESAPRLLHAGLAKGITTQSFVEGRSGARRLGPSAWRLLHSLVLPGRETSLAEYTGEWKEALDCHAEARTENNFVAKVMEDVGDDSPLPACWEHGDFAPWNIKRLADGRGALSIGKARGEADFRCWTRTTSCTCRTSFLIGGRSCIRRKWRPMRMSWG